MFFILSKLIGFLTMPTTIIVGCFILSLIFRKKAFGRRFNILGIIALLFFTNPLTYKLALKYLEIEPVRFDEVNETYDYGIVLTGMLTLDALPEDRIHFNHSADRINHAIELYKRGIIRKILITGGSSAILDNIVREAPLLLNYAIGCGVSREDIIIEPDARNTFENAKFSLDLVKYNELAQKPRLLIITSAYHMRRASACFAKLGAEFDTFSTGYQTKPMQWSHLSTVVPSDDALKWWHAIIKEIVGMATYKISGYI